MKYIKHIFFDLDHTLWDYEKNSRETLLFLFTEHQIEKSYNITFENFIQTFETINYNLWHQYSLKKITREDLRRQRFHQTFNHFNINQLELTKLWADDYLKITPYKTHLIDGAIDTLNYLKDRYNLHLITNGFKEVQYIKLDSSGLKTYFDHLIISEDHGYRKPNINIFRIAENLANTTKSECVIIGDNYEADILGALNAGWKAVYLSPTPLKQENEKTTRIEKLSELKQLFGNENFTLH